MNKKTDKQEATMIISGFRNTIKYWWVNYLTDNNRQNIFNATIITQAIKNDLTGQTVENKSQKM